MAKTSYLSELPFTVPQLIAQKRDGLAIDADHLRSFVNAYVAEEVTDYQMAAFAMATYFQGMRPAETAALTLAMRDSGRVIDLSGVEGIKVDKHSTGGVGDKVSICLAPIVAACGVPVPMISGRGLGHTGGTLDKLEAIEGFRVDGSVKRFRKQLSKIGCSLFGQTGEIAPADRKLYALRDVTATVESIPLITASILSKKLAEGIDALVLDVKVGRGAFMKDQESARALAKSIVRVGKLAGKKVTAFLTRMDAPLGNTIGNAIETAEAFDVLHGEGPEDLIECTTLLAEEMLRLGGVAKTAAQARKLVQEAIASGAAVEKMQQIVAAQGGDPKVVAKPSKLIRGGTKRVPVLAAKSGFVGDIDALALGYVGVKIGAGRTRSDQSVDPDVGIVLKAKPGDAVEEGQPLAELIVRKKKHAAAVMDETVNAFTLSARKPKESPLRLETIRR